MRSRRRHPLSFSTPVPSGGSVFVFQEEDHVFIFSKKPKFTVRVKEYTTPLLIGGLWTEVHKKTLKKEIGSLQTRFQELRPNLKQLSDPKGTLVISRPAEPEGSFAYFIGELTDTAEQDSSFAVESLACGPYAHISVSFQDPTELTWLWRGPSSSFLKNGFQPPDTPCSPTSNRSSSMTGEATSPSHRWN